MKPHTEYVSSHILDVHEAKRLALVRAEVALWPSGNMSAVDVLSANGPMVRDANNSMKDWWSAILGRVVALFWGGSDRVPFWEGLVLEMLLGKECLE